MKTQIVYKVVRATQHPEKFRSYIVECSANIEYCLGEECVPTLGKLFVFKDLELAELFAKRSRIGYVILKGIAKSPRRIKKVSSILGRSSIENFWERKRKKKYQVHSRLAPHGSFVCDSFTPIEVVKIK